jgi:hypothetical protein
MTSQDAYGATSEAVRKVFTSYRTLDPVRAAALHEAVRAVDPDDDTTYDPLEKILDAAERFAAWLAGPENT